ncbi:MAG TPA: hypothetical protein VHT97_06230 [Acidimicrobiales bacterium]|jgi:hypothetical protein|nr:hypothetical protein [Acidimicrobiales bacterium]
MIAASKPWTYWLAPLLLALTALSLIAWALLYYRKVVVPESYLDQWRDVEAQAVRARSAAQVGGHKAPTELSSGQQSAPGERAVTSRRAQPAEVDRARETDREREMR